MRIIGIDGGASKVSGGIVEKINLNTYKLVEPAVDIKYIEHPNYNTDFLPLPLYLQSENRISPNEKNQGSVFIDCVLEVIQSLADSNPIQVAIAMPGIKNKEGRGIIAMANGPRIPDFCDQIEHVINLKQPIQRLESDADMCTWGEEFAEGGALRDVKNGYYIGGGTGVADGLKLNGDLVPFDDATNWIAKSFELKMPSSQSLETYASMSGINKHRLSKSDFEIGKVLGSLLFERISTIYSGWNNQFKVGRILQANHSYINTLLDRIVIGQRLSQFLQSEDGDLIYQSMIGELKDKCLNAAVAISNYYIVDGEFNNDIIVMSNLRAAPIIGLGAKVWMNQC